LTSIMLPHKKTADDMKNAAEKIKGMVEIVNKQDLLSLTII